MIDWNDAFDNGGHVAGSADFADRWAARARAARAEFARHERAQLDLPYGERPRNRFDLFLPPAAPAGLVVFVHGGYWHKLDKSYWSHLAAGPLARGWAVAVPGYTLAPEVRIAQITAEIGRAIAAAGKRIDGPIRLSGHSAGGHLVARMACANAPLEAAARTRLARVVSISGVHHLQPLLLTDMNRTLRLDAAEAALESPLLLPPRSDLDIGFWVGAAERPEFLRQTRAIAEAWGERGARVDDHYEPGRHHFDVVEGLADPDSALLGALLD